MIDKHFVELTLTNKSSLKLLDFNLLLIYRWCSIHIKKYKKKYTKKTICIIFNLSIDCKSKNFFLESGLIYHMYFARHKLHIINPFRWKRKWKCSHQDLRKVLWLHKKLNGLIVGSFWWVKTTTKVVFFYSYKSWYGKVRSCWLKTKNSFLENRHNCLCGLLQGCTVKNLLQKPIAFWRIV